MNLHVRVTLFALLLPCAALPAQVAADPATARAAADRAAADRTAADRAAALAVADSALALISRNDFSGLADLMLPEARTFSGSERDGVGRYSTRTREEQRVARVDGGITERGFGPTVLVSGTLAVVWMPYDLYRGGAWSHCGVDALTMYKVAGQWRIANFAWTVEQPPACNKHPDGPPRP